MIEAENQLLSELNQADESDYFRPSHSALTSNEKQALNHYNDFNYYNDFKPLKAALSVLAPARRSLL